MVNGLNVSNGDNTVYFDVPATATPDSTFTRFRLSTAGTTNFAGPAADGEVEDYLITIDTALPDACFREKKYLGDMSAYENPEAIDLDRDGHIDIIAVSANSNNILWLKNDGQGNFTTSTLGTSSSYIYAISTVDLNGDGFFDIIFSTNNPKKIYWMENDGNQNFTTHFIMDTEALVFEIETADLDHDSDIDIITQEGNFGYVYWLENNGQQNFTSHTFGGVEFDHYFDIEIVDLDKNGALDIVYFRYDSICWLRNDGFQNFTDISIDDNPSHNCSSVEVLDINNDDELDLVVARNDGHVWVFTNDGQENFTKTDYSFPGERFESSGTSDFDGDGDMDFVFAGFTGFYYGINNGNGQLDIQQFNISNLNVHSFYSDVPFADFDENGTIDILAGYYPRSNVKLYWLPQNYYDYGDAPEPYPVTDSENGTYHTILGPRLGSSIDYEQDGAHSPGALGDNGDDGISNWQNLNVGAVDASVTINIQNGPAKISAWIDWDGDGSWGGLNECLLYNHYIQSDGDTTLTFDVPEWAVSDTTFARFRISGGEDMSITGFVESGEVEDYAVVIGPPVEGNGDLETQVIKTDDLYRYQPAIADFDNDGDNDFVISEGDEYDNNAKLLLFENDGLGNFTADTVDNLTKSINSIPVAADLDSDGDQDIVFHEFELHNNIFWYENDGSAAFTKDTVGVFPGLYRLAVADINEDGSMDVIVCGTSTNKVAWFQNDGNQNFSMNVVDNTQNAYNVAVSDLNHDGFLDIIVIAEAEGPHYLKFTWYENDGEENFTAHDILLSGDVTLYKDFNDLSVTDINRDGFKDIVAFSYDKLFYLINDGLQNFTLHTFTTTALYYFSLDVGDVNGDGYPDIMEASYNAKWHENTGSDSWIKHDLNPTEDSPVRLIKMADIDGDGDMDILTEDLEGGRRLKWMKQGDPQLVDITRIDSITESNALYHVNIHSRFQENIVQKGVCWNQSGSPTISDNHSNNGSGKDSFSGTITGLTGPGTTYFIRAYTITNNDTTYWDETVFATYMESPGNALNFDGVDDYIDGGGDTTLTPTINFTIEAWVKPDTLPGKQCVVNLNNNYSLEIISSDSQTNWIGVYLGNTLLVDVHTDALITGFWNHITFRNIQSVFDYRSEIRLNGNYLASRTHSNFPVNQHAHLYIGAKNGSEKYYSGLMDGVRIWNVYRSLTEVRENMYRVIDENETGLLACYRFDHIAGMALSDITDKYDASLENMADTVWVNSTAPMPYESGSDGIWSDTTNWLIGQGSPSKSWSRVRINSNITMDEDKEVIELTIENGKTLTINNSKTLTVSGSSGGN